MPLNPTGTIPQDDSVQRELRRKVRRAERAEVPLDAEILKQCAEYGIDPVSENWATPEEIGPEVEEVEEPAEAPDFLPEVADEE